MSRQRLPEHRADRAGHDDHRSVGSGTQNTSEEILIRSYDHRWAYDLEIEAIDQTDRSRFRKRYYLQPGQIEGERDVLPAGEYELRITLDNTHHKTVDCRIGSSPADTVVIEIGNGTMSITQGLYS
ncbi:MAG: hypothetical protein ABEJ48_08935 [Halobacteriales archaeon]